MGNVIDRYFENECVLRHYRDSGVNPEATRQWCHRACALDAMKDEPLPQWAIDIMALGRVSYRARKYLLIEHNKDIFYARKGKGVKDERRTIESRKRQRYSPDDIGRMERQSRAALGLSCEEGEKKFGDEEEPL